jgi:uncharacterized membrane protein
MPFSAPSMVFDNFLLTFYILWSVAKFIFYVLPITDLIRIKNYAGRRADIAITYVTLIPVLEFVAYYYVVTRIVEKILENERGRRMSGILACQIYGIAAGILNTVLVILFANMSHSNGFQHSAQDLWAVMAMNFIIFSSWLFLSYLHLRGVFMARRLLLTNRSRSTA